MRLLLLTLLCLTPRAVFGATYLVRADGAGDYTTIQACENRPLAAGDICEVTQAGTYAGFTVDVSGSSGNHIIFRAAAGVAVTLSSAVNVTNEQYVTIQRFTFSFGGGSAVVCNGCSFIWMLSNIVNNTDIGFGNAGNASACAGGTYLCGNDLLFDGNILTQQRGDDVFKMNGSRWVIRNTVAGNINDVEDEHIDFIQFHAQAALTRGGSNQNEYLLENNTYYNVVGPNTHGLLMNCGNVSGVHGRYIFRHNRIRDLQSRAVSWTTGGSCSFVGAAVYNNTFYNSNQTITGPAAMSSISNDISPNNIVYNSMTQTGAIGFSGSGNCNNTLYYDPDGSISLSRSGCLASATGNVANKDPLFVNAASNDFSLQAGSPAIDAGTHLTTTTNSGSSSTALTVANAYGFQPGWAGTQADWICIGTVSNCVQISAITYATGAITLGSALTWSSSAPVWLYKNSEGTIVLVGAAPDIGAVEYR